MVSRALSLAVVASLFMLGACGMPTEDTGVSYGEGSNQQAYVPPVYTAPEPAVQQEADIQAGDRVFFDFNSAVLTAEAQQTLTQQSAWLRNHPEKNVTLEGHCDERGTREYNLALGDRRANAAKNYLITLGIGASRISTISYGKERPAVEGHNEWAWSQNRRTVTIVTN